MNREIRDDAAIAFTRGFYAALGNGAPIKTAYDLGKSQVAIEISSDATLTADSRKMIPIDSLTPKQESLIRLFCKQEPLTIFDDKMPTLSPPLSQPEPPISADFLYDAYICYVDREPDSTWVWDTLVPKLDSAGLNVAVSGDIATPGVAQVVN